ncbi:gluconokinase [Sinorhizobium meliloti]|uniref:gluconokinase n=1 Tax=Rhizobium meliloti TaxID=382 RepID=UPI000FD28A6C|nr:gluconokinase [Sinorhizobium meliloti]MQV20533.1 AAA family ATPase [Sinorhizobium meliloti]MQV32716.1 AAA family ATPase [Sinorhizobium meliloti]RVE85639.1 gluconokinase [Sinorhizobium meliloti]RVG49012.1 gluconokinase [Sinorhizobium meliloti]RVM03844.1 gluconokinase [Sinorhizobium meliloti]
MADTFTGLHSGGAQTDPILVMGIAGTGKSEIACRLATTLGGAFIEADSYHSAENVERMRQGIGLTDADRWPWLAAVAQAARGAENHPVIIACSALRRSYRDFLRDRIGPLRILYLEGSPELIAARLARRKGHFATGSLLESQLRALEPPAEDERVVRLDIRLSPEAIVAAALASLDGRAESEG